MSVASSFQWSTIIFEPIIQASTVISFHPSIFGRSSIFLILLPWLVQYHCFLTLEDLDNIHAARTMYASLGAFFLCSSSCCSSSQLAKRHLQGLKSIFFTLLAKTTSVSSVFATWTQKVGESEVLLVRVSGGSSQNSWRFRWLFIGLKGLEIEWKPDVIISKRGNCS